MAAVMGERALTLRLSDPAWAAEQIADRARRTPFAAIVAVDEEGVMAAALGAERLGLPHNPPDAVARTRDKAALRRAFAQAGVPQPRFALLDAGADVAAVAREVGLPCVVKPLSLSGSRGVIRAKRGRGGAGGRRARPGYPGYRPRAGRRVAAGGELPAGC
jgi:biotin carboxylase